jgi:hypothetical protein
VKLLKTSNADLKKLKAEIKRLTNINKDLQSSSADYRNKPEAWEHQVGILIKERDNWEIDVRRIKSWSEQALRNCYKDLKRHTITELTPAGKQLLYVHCWFFAWTPRHIVEQYANFRHPTEGNYYLKEYADIIVKTYGY